jgi:hypothetical protein
LVCRSGDEFKLSPRAPFHWFYARPTPQIPAARRAIEAEKATTLKQIRDHAVGAANPNAPAFRRTLPETGVARTQVLALLKVRGARSL